MPDHHAHIPAVWESGWGASRYKPLGAQCACSAFSRRLYPERLIEMRFYYEAGAYLDFLTQTQHRVKYATVCSAAVNPS